MHGGLRGAIIAYGAAAAAFFLPPLAEPQAGGSAGVAPLLVAGIALQRAILAARRFVNTEPKPSAIGPKPSAIGPKASAGGPQVSVTGSKARVAGSPPSGGGVRFSPRAVFIFELLADALTVLLFSLATMRGIAQQVAGI